MVTLTVATGSRKSPCLSSFPVPTGVLQWLADRFFYVCRGLKRVGQGDLCGIICLLLTFFKWQKTEVHEEWGKREETSWRVS